MLFPQDEHDDLFDGIQRTVERAMGCSPVTAKWHPPFARWQDKLSITRLSIGQARRQSGTRQHLVDAEHICGARGLQHPKPEEVMLVRRSLVWVSVLLALWLLPGCGRVDDERSATIVIAEGNSLDYKRVGQDEPVIHYGPGDTVIVEFKNDTCYVNGQPHMPHPVAPRRKFTVGLLRSLYGNVPLVASYVASHSGDSTEVWNQAVRELDVQMKQVVSAAFQQYKDDLLAGKSPDAAAERVVLGLRLSQLVDSAYVDETRSSPDSKNRYVMVAWAGKEYEEDLWLEPAGPRGVRRQRHVDAEDFKAFVQLLRGLEEGVPMTVELRGGNMVVRRGPKAELRREGR